MLLILKELPALDSKHENEDEVSRHLSTFVFLSGLALHAITAQRYEVTNMAGAFPWQVEMMKEQPSDTGIDSNPITTSNPRKTGTCFDSQIQGFLWLGQTSFLEADGLYRCAFFHYVLLIRTSTQQPISLYYCFDYTLDESFSSACKCSAWVFARVRLLGRSMWL